MQCCAEWHLAKLQSKNTAALIHSLALKVSKQSGLFAVSATQLAAYLNTSERTVRRATHELVDAGFFEVVQRRNGTVVMYRPVNHRDWAAAHPAQCFSGEYGHPRRGMQAA
jgi:DNA-binding transcriptional regulator YhcF (GntR family)